MIKLSIFVGTRPELIKLAPLIQSFARNPGLFDLAVIATGQHNHLLKSITTQLDVQIDKWLKLSPRELNLDAMTAGIISGTGASLKSLLPDIVIVQGDTASSLAVTLSAALNNIPVAHIEAGLRTGNPRAPFPEEMNRKAISQLASLHFAPTSRARENLLREGICPTAVAVTGNTAVDSLYMTLQKRRLQPAIQQNRKKRLIVVTCHRRESWHVALSEICLAVSDLPKIARDIEIRFVMPNNPALHKPIRQYLEGLARIHLIKPLEYGSFIDLLSQASLILTDSGGIQEEVPSLGIPTIVMRNETDRPEISHIPFIHLAGTRRHNIIRAARQLLALNQEELTNPLRAINPFGDGHASGRIAEALQRWWQGRYPLLPPSREFSNNKKRKSPNGSFSLRHLS